MMVTMLDIVNALLQEEDTESKLTKSEFRDIRNSMDESALIDAVNRMEEAGGYDNLPD